MRLHAQGLIQGGYLGNRTALGTPANPALPPNRPKQAGHLARSKALTPHSAPAPWAAGPDGGLTRPLGEHSFDEADREYTAHLPRGQEQRGEGRGVFERTQQTLHNRIIVAYAVVQA